MSKQTTCERLEEASMARTKAMHITEAEEKLAGIIWREAPLTSPELVALAEQELNWKKSTTYTILRKLCSKGIFANVNANISVLLTRDEQNVRQGRRFVEDLFDGSLPKMVSAFIGDGALTPEQAIEIRQMIDEYKAGMKNG